jgi:hypothetical protein
MPCVYCNIVNRLCFWGSRPEAAWKRPILFLLSVVTVVGSSWVLWAFRSRPDAFILLVLAGAFVMVGALSVLVSIRGCNACVARLFGEI